jgi:hypothetical protein
MKSIPALTANCASESLAIRAALQNLATLE